MLTKNMQEDIQRQMPLKSRDIDVCLMGALDESLPREYVLDCLLIYCFTNAALTCGFFLFGDPYETRTRVTAVKGRCLNPLTTGPLVAAMGLEPMTFRV